jgi:glycerol-3-phosphate dehydrogenase (NAD(P)+)
MTEQRPIAVLGGGSFGTAVANLLAENGHQVLQWMRDPEQAEAIRVNRENPRYLKGIKILPGVTAVTDLQATLDACDLCFVALPSSALRTVLAAHAERLSGKMLVSLTKGIEAQTFKLMSQILEEIAPQARIGVLSGPNLAREIAEHALTATVVASEDEDLCKAVQAALHGRTFRVYASADRFGVELGGALKNVYAIIAGMAVALEMGENTKSMLITRALAEMTRFAVNQGANPMTFLGLAGVGDLIVTCSSPKSRNYQVGFALGQGLSLDEAVSRLGEVAEGVNTLKVLKAKSQEVGVYMPLVAGLHAILFEGTHAGAGDRSTDASRAENRRRLYFHQWFQLRPQHGASHERSENRSQVRIHPPAGAVDDRLRAGLAGGAVHPRRGGAGATDLSFDLWRAERQPDEFRRQPEPVSGADRPFRQFPQRPETVAVCRLANAAYPGR